MPERHHHHHHYYHKEREGYAYHAGEPGPGPNRHRLRRNTRKGQVAGVCAGIADYFGWDVGWLRFGLIVSAIFAFPLPIVAYFAAAIMMKSDRGQTPSYQSTDEERFWRTFSVKPKATFSELKHRFRALDARIEQMEYAVTSKEYGLRKEFRDLERGA